jgi:BRCT domain type II-containing protein
MEGMRTVITSNTAHKGMRTAVTSKKPKLERRTAHGYSSRYTNPITRTAEVSDRVTLMKMEEGV